MDAGQDNSTTENPLFSKLDAGQLEELNKLSISRSYPKDQWITHYGSDWPHLFLVEEGQVTALKESSGGRSLVVTSLEKGDVFWGTGFFKEGMGMPVALVANQETRLRLWSRERLQPFMINNGQFTWDLDSIDGGTHDESQPDPGRAGLSTRSGPAGTLAPGAIRRSSWRYCSQRFNPG